MRETRPIVCILTTHWGDGADEATEVVRLLAGAVARCAKVHVVHLDGACATRHVGLDSVFTVHRLPLAGAAPTVASILRGALATAGGDAVRSLEDMTHALDGHPVGLRETLEEIGAACLVLAGLPVPVTAAELSEIGAPRMVLWPMLSDLSLVGDERVAAFVRRADVVATLHPGEQRKLLEAFPERAEAIVPLDIALTLNRSATEQGLFGVGWFGRYVLLLRQFPANGPRFDRTVTHELLRSVLGDVAVAEVDGRGWRVSDFGNTAQLPVNPTRVNLWRLMAHSEFTVDLRPPSPFGREAIESMLFSSPPIVPEGSAAHSHVERANGGLWYRTPGEVLDLASVLIDEEGLASRLKQDGLRYASSHHEQMEAFVLRSKSLILG